MEHEETMGRNRRGGVCFVVGIRWIGAETDAGTTYWAGCMNRGWGVEEGAGRTEVERSRNTVPEVSPKAIRPASRPILPPAPPGPMCMAEESRHWIYRTTV